MRIWIPLVALASALGCGRAPAGTRPATTDATTAAAISPAVAAAASAAPDAGVAAGTLPTAEKVRPAVDAAAKALVDGEWTPGLVVALIDESGETFLTYGVARAGGPAVDADTIFEIGSVTKVFTSLALAQLAAAGKVHLDEPVADLLPKGTKVPEKEGKKITLEQLATHRSGLLRTPGEPKDANDPYQDWDAKRLYKYLSYASLATAPGAAFEYSNTGGGLLGFALALRAKVPYARLVIDGIARPLGMKSTYVEVPKAAQAHQAQGHADGMPVPAWHFDALAGAGVLRSSARDLARFVRAEMGLLPEAEVPAPLRAAMDKTQEERAEAGGGGKIGLGWLITRDGQRHWHNGGTGGFRSYVAFDRARKRGIVVLANGSDDVINKVGISLAQAWNGIRAEPMKLSPTVKLDTAKLDEYVGEYPITDKFIIKVWRVGEHLRLQASQPGQAEMGLWALGSDRFYLRVVDAKVEFERDKDGKVAAMVLEQSGARQRAPRHIPGTPMPTLPTVAPESHGGLPPVPAIP